MFADIGMHRAIGAGVVPQFRGIIYTEGFFMKCRYNLLFRAALGAAAVGVVAASCAKKNASTSPVKDAPSSGLQLDAATSGLQLDAPTSGLQLKESAAYAECGNNGVTHDTVQDYSSYTDMDCPGSLPEITTGVWTHLCAYSIAQARLACEADGVLHHQDVSLGDSGLGDNGPTCYTEIGVPMPNTLPGFRSGGNFHGIPLPPIPTISNIHSYSRAACNMAAKPATCQRVSGSHAGPDYLITENGQTNKFCQIYKTVDELGLFIDGRYDSLKTQAEAAVILEANYYVSFRKTTELSCLINSLTAPDQSQVKDQITVLYKNFFGADPISAECLEFKTLAVQDACDAGVDSLKCKTMKSLSDSRAKFESIKSEFTAVSRNISDIKGASIGGSSSFTDAHVSALEQIKTLLQSFGFKN